MTGRNQPITAVAMQIAKKLIYIGRIRDDNADNTEGSRKTCGSLLRKQLHLDFLQQQVAKKISAPVETEHQPLKH